MLTGISEGGEVVERQSGGIAWVHGISRRDTKHDIHDEFNRKVIQRGEEAFEGDGGFARRREC